MTAVKKQAQKSSKTVSSARAGRAHSVDRRAGTGATQMRTGRSTASKAQKNPKPKKRGPAEIERDFMRPSARLDRRIIEGMLNDRDALMAELTKDGVTEAMVLRRAAECGVSESLIRQVKGVVADLAGDRPGRGALPNTMRPRNCLSCERVFLSLGPANRLCIRCRGGDAGLSAMC